MPIEDLALLGGRISLDFANTIDPRTGPATRGLLSSYDDLLRWAVHASVLAPDEGARLMADVSKAKKQSALAEAVAIRAAIVCVFNRRSSAEATDVLRRAHVDALSRASLVPDRPAWRLADGPHRVADAIVVDAMELLFSPDLHRVKSCPAIEGCGWLFVDSTRNGTRRWCSMRYCGSRAKAIRASERRRRT